MEKIKKNIEFIVGLVFVISQNVHDMILLAFKHGSFHCPYKPLKIYREVPGTLRNHISRMLG